MVRKYSWAIPCEEALSEISSYGPIVKIGAGTGYWSALLKKRGVNVIAYDEQPAESGRNGYVYKSKSWTEVLPGTESAASFHPDRSLLLCWCQFQKSLSPDFRSPCHQLSEVRQEEVWRRIFLDRFSKVVVTSFNFNVV